MPAMRSQAGVTLLEIMLALGLLAVGSYLTIEGIGQMTSITKETKNLSSTERQINVIVDNIRTGLGVYQITFDPSTSVKEQMLNISTLPMAWNVGAVVPVKECEPKKNCPAGRYGFVVQPKTASSKGLYQVTLRMTHPDWNEKYRDYEFLVTVQ